MSWPLLLSGYPRPILKGNLPLVILAFLERGGLVTESQLIKQAGADERQVKEALFDLNLSKLIEYGSHHLRLTERGREVIDRFQLDRETVGDILDLLRLKGKEREVYQLALGAYRSTSYTNYLNSVSSLWTMVDIADIASLGAAEHLSEEAGLGMFVLLTSDIAQWWKRISVQPAAAQFSNVTAGYCDSISASLRVWTEVADDKNLLSQYARALTAARVELDDQIEDRSLEKTPVARCFFYFFNFRSKSEPSRWFDEWTELKLSIPEARRERSGYYLEAIQRELLQRAASHVALAKRYDSDQYLIADKYPAGGSDTFLEHLLVSVSMQELMKLSGMSYQSLKLLLEKIVERCHTLMEDEPNTTSGR